MDRPISVTAGPARPLHDTATTRLLEARAAATLAPHTLMQRAGLSVARLALAIAPHARRIWIACGPGNNGGDGLEAAAHLKSWGREPVVTCLEHASGSSDWPADAAASLARAQAAGVTFADAPPAAPELVIDALFGIGRGRPLEGQAAQWRDLMNASGAKVLAVDLPSGLDADTGAGEAVRATHTLSLLTLKPGLFTAHGRDAAGQLWWDDLGVPPVETASAILAPAPTARPRAHASHKGSWGDVAIIGGAPGMTGAALLAARAAIGGGAGRVFVGLLDGGTLSVDPLHPELMLRSPETLDTGAMHVACGSGGGQAVRVVLPKLLSQTRSLVLDADALNAIAVDASLQTLLRARTSRGEHTTILTPHPLEAARLLGISAAQVQADRLQAAGALAEKFGGVTVLKGSGTVIAQVGRAPWINPTGNARLATAGTGDVLTGLIAARLAQGESAFEAAAHAVYEHGQAADQWPAGQAFTASSVISAIAGSIAR